MTRIVGPGPRTMPAASIRQQLHQPFVGEGDFLAGFHFGHEAGGGGVVEVAGGGDAVAEAGFLEVADFAVGADEKLLDEFVGKGALGEFELAFLGAAREQVANGPRFSARSSPRHDHAPGRRVKFPLPPPRPRDN